MNDLAFLEYFLMICLLIISNLILSLEEKIYILLVILFELYKKNTV